MKNALSLVFLVLMATLVLLFVFFSENKPITKDLHFSYSVAGCKKHKSLSKSKNELSNFSYEFKNGKLYFSYRLSYVCCAELALNANANNNKIIVKVTNNGEMCKCICSYDINAEIENLNRDRYLLEIYGIYFKDFNAGLLFKTNIEKEKPYYGFSTYAKCEKQGDCRVGGCNAEICQGANENLSSVCVFPKKPTPARLNYKCKCINKRCQWYK